MEHHGYDYPTDHDNMNFIFDGYDKGNGKCRLPDGSFGSSDSYYPTGPNDPDIYRTKKVRDIKHCKEVCDKDSDCVAFHFYLLDPGAYNNCWIWTVDGYLANGSDKAYCHVKRDDFVLDPNADYGEIDEAWDAEQEGLDGERGEKPSKSLNDYDEEFEQTLQEMLDRMEKDKQALYDELEAYEDCHVYEPTSGCVNGENMEKHKDKTLK